MLYRLKWKTEGPAGWNRAHQVVGDINAVHTLYNHLVDQTRRTGFRLQAEVRSVSTGESDGALIYSWGTSFPTKHFADSDDAKSDT